MDKNSKTLSEKLQALIKDGGSIIFAIGDYYVQFAKDKSDKDIYFEAVSHYFLDILSKNVSKEFSKLSFKIDDGNYYKKVDINNIESIIDNVQTIFQNIYKVNYEKEFDVTDDIEYSNSSNKTASNSQTRQLQIPHSNPHAFHDERKIFLANNKKATIINSSQIISSRVVGGVFIILILIASLAIYKYRNNNNNNNNVDDNNDSTTVATGTPVTSYKKVTKEFNQPTLPQNENTIDVNELTGQKFIFKSTLNDKEYDGEIIQTNHETTYHTFDFINKTVTEKMPLAGKWITITYPMNGYYKEENILGTTHVIQVNELGVKEIWFNPKVPNLGYDYLDGSRIACYQLSKK